MHTRFEQARIHQLLSLYSPADAPKAPLDFGDYLSILWRIDQAAALPTRARYYRTCAQSLAQALGFSSHPLYRLVELAEPGAIYTQLSNIPYRSGSRLVDAQDRKAAISQLVAIRHDMLRMGTYQENWVTSWPGSGIQDVEVRERVFAVLFTALQGQFGNFARLLLVVDIVLAELLLGIEATAEVTLADLVEKHGYPNPKDPRWQREYLAENDR